MTTTLAPSVERRLDEMADQILFLTEDVSKRQELRASITELTGDLTPIARQDMDSVTRALLEAETMGYIDFLRRGLGVIDRVMTSYTEEDVEALGDNIVLILDTIKEMTQPEVMQMMQSTVHSVSKIGEEAQEPPGLFALLGQMRDPEVRRGLGRLMAVLGSMGQISEKGNDRKEAQQ